MAPGELVTIIRNQIQDSWNKRTQVRERLGSLEKNLAMLLESIEEIDDRRVNGIDISTYKEDLKSFLKKHFDINDRDLETAEQKQRFDLEMKRAETTIELEDLENRIANCNGRLVQVDASSGTFGTENYEPRNLEMYNLLITLEKALRNMILKTFESSGIKKWWKGNIPKGSRKMADEKYREDRPKFEFPAIGIRPIDYLDFSDYYQIFNYGPNHKIFFQNDQEKGAILTKLYELRDLRNKIVHRPPLDDGESDKFRIYYSDIMSFVKKLEKQND